MSKTKQLPTDLRTLNRDLLRAPAVLKAKHINTGPHSRFIIGPEWLSNSRWIVRRASVSIGGLLSPCWLRTKTLGLISEERNVLLRILLGLPPKSDVRFEIVEREAKLIAEFSAIDPDKLVKYRRTRSTYFSDWSLYTVYKADSGAILGVDSRWADLFSLSYVWRAETGPIINNPDKSKADVILVDKGLLPEEAAFAAHIGGFAPDPVVEAPAVKKTKKVAK